MQVTFTLTFFGAFPGTVVAAGKRLIMSRWWVLLQHLQRLCVTAAKRPRAASCYRWDKFYFHFGTTRIRARIKCRSERTWRGSKGSEPLALPVSARENLLISGGSGSRAAWINPTLKTFLYFHSHRQHFSSKAKIYTRMWRVLCVFKRMRTVERRPVSGKACVHTRSRLRDQRSFPVLLRPLQVSFEQFRQGLNPGVCDAVLIFTVWVKTYRTTSKYIMQRCFLECVVESYCTYSVRNVFYCVRFSQYCVTQGKETPLH